ncbi:MAG: GNAT family N-acetyltransferase [Chloroflexi bacterium]|nr:GNAT family N-acetyltransferase [Chloroflexota bacterium]
MPHPPVRLATHDDIDCLRRCFKGFADLLHADIGTDEQIDQNLRLLLDDPLAEFFVAFDENGDCAGALQQRYRHSLWLTALEANIEDLFVMESHRRQGYGKALMEFALARASERGCGRVVLDVTESNSVPLGMYERMGFTSHHERPIPGGRHILYIKTLR